MDRDLTALSPTEMDDLFVSAWHKESSTFNIALHYKQEVEKGHTYYEKAAAEAETAYREARAEVRKLDGEWARRGGWSRYWLVVNHDGHVHRDTNCSTTYPTTQWALPTNLSGMTEEEMIASVGMTACTVCFPEAPVHPEFIRTLAESEEEKAAKLAAQCSGSGEYAQNVSRAYSPYATCHVCGKRGVSVTRGGKLRGHKTPEADKAELVAKVAADPKKILSANGEVLRSQYGEVKTVVSARSELADALYKIERGDLTYRKWVGGDQQYVEGSRLEYAETIIEALMAKLDQSRDEVIASMEKALKTRRKRGY
jgi:hypothetical protein